MNIIEHIRTQYGEENVRNFLRFHNFGIPEMYWLNTDSVIVQKAKDVIEMVRVENIMVTAIITEDKKLTDKFIAEILKLLALESEVKLFWFDFFLSEFFNKWNGVFDFDKMNSLIYKSAIGIMGVTPEGMNDLKINILVSFSKFINSIIRTGTITRIFIGLDTMKKSDIGQLYGTEFESVIDKTLSIKVK